MMLREELFNLLFDHYCEDPDKVADTALALVVERCAKVAERRAVVYQGGSRLEVGKEIAAAIRALAGEGRGFKSPYDCYCGLCESPRCMKGN